MTFKKLSASLLALGMTALTVAPMATSAYEIIQEKTFEHVDLNGNPTMDEDYNVNGSYAAIEGITSPDGRVLGKMAHSERRGDSVAVNIFGDQNQLIFESGVEYFK